LYPATLLYIWKAALPYKVPYDDELRHRVAYNSQGDHADYRGSNQTEFNHLFHNYNDELHLRNMVKIAAGMDVAPPVALLKPLEVKGGTVVYDTLKTALLIRQGEDEEIRIRLSAADSYDLQGWPLTFRWKVLYGHRDVQIRREGETAEYTLVIPFDKQLPRGRTSILLIANNGRYDSNPAVVNIYRTAGKDNLRPTLEGLRDLTILPGERAIFRLSGRDPEGFPVVFSQWDGEVGRIEGDTFTWQCPPFHPAGVEPVTVIVSDGSAGNGYNSGRAFITVSPTAACLRPDPPQGPAPLRVSFSSEGSRDLKNGPLRYEWNFDDGSVSGEPNPVHTFTPPGFYEVSLTVTGPSGRHTARSVVRVEPQWPLAIENGWGKDGIDRAVWQLTDPDTAIVHVSGRDGGFVKIYDPKLEKPGPHGLTSLKKLAPPLYLEASFFSVLDGIRPGTGFSILGTQLGYIEAPGESGRNISIGRPLAAGGWASRFIASKVRFPWQKSNLRLFLDADPAHPGRFRYTGFLESDTGENFFRLDNQELPSEGPISIVSGSARSRFELYSIRIWAGKTPSPAR
ncbi:MAG TPA: PKD domain-containing protein, partial [bacterium]|nr:PKD domain-containing protein [bacterium]